MKTKKILILNPEEDMVKEIKASSHAKKYIFEQAETGSECLHKMASFHPDLLLIDLMLPEKHGIELLKEIRLSPKSQHVGVIIASFNPMAQNYYAAWIAGADYYLHKPFKAKKFFEIAEQFFAKKLKFAPFSPASLQKKEKKSYLPKLLSPKSYIKFWGTRGSSPVSGPGYVRYGGNTSCLEVKYEDDLIIIDAGTGIRPLGEELASRKENTIHLFLGHTHWDHITGFPFFAPVYNPKAHIILYSPIGFEKTTEELFTEMLAYTYFPVRMEEIKAKLTFKDLKPNETVTIGNIAVDTHYTYHPGATLCFKVKAGNTTFAYATDNEILMGFHGNPSSLKKKDPRLLPHQSLIKFFKDCDFLIHEAQYTPQEYQNKVGWGHSSIPNAAAIVKEAGVSDWIVTHHDPRHTDDDLQNKLELHHEIMKDLHVDCHLQMAFDQLILPI